jgi:hypothetical protein
MSKLNKGPIKKKKAREEEQEWLGFRKTFYV